MPVYLLHGFRWPRPLIRIHIILQNIDDAAAEWLVAAPTTSALKRNFSDLWPDIMTHLSQLRFVEQYDPHDTSPAAASQPYAYVADVVEEIRLGVDVEEVRGKGVKNEQWSAMMELRDKLAPDEKVGWFVVVCGDEERWAPPTVSLLQGGGAVGGRVGDSEVGSQDSAGSERRNMSPQSPNSASGGGLKKWFGSRRSLSKRQSRTEVRAVSRSPGLSPQAPPLPGTAA